MNLSIRVVLMRRKTPLPLAAENELFRITLVHHAEAKRNYNSVFKKKHNISNHFFNHIILLTLQKQSYQVFLISFLVQIS